MVAIVLLLSLHRFKFANSLLNANQPVALLLTLFGAAILVAGFAELFGFSAAVAAFLVGLLFTDEVAEVARQRLAPLRDLFAAVFFVFFGLNTNPADIPPVLPSRLPSLWSGSGPNSSPVGSWRSERSRVHVAGGALVRCWPLAVSSVC